MSENGENGSGVGGLEETRDKAGPGHFRLFIALTVPDAIQREIQKVQAELREAAPKAVVRWTCGAQMHLTLRFLGNVAARDFEALQATVRQACARFAPMLVVAGGVGFFPDGRFPRVIWVGVGDRDEQLPQLQRSVQEATAGFTAEKPEGRFMGHVTLGRIKRVRQDEADALAEVAARYAGRECGRWLAEELEIVRSELSAEGARYTTVAQCRFRLTESV